MPVQFSPACSVNHYNFFGIKLGVEQYRSRFLENMFMSDSLLHLEGRNEVPISKQIHSGTRFFFQRKLAYFQRSCRWNQQGRRKYEETEIVFKNLHFRDGLVWTEGLTVEIKLLIVDAAYDRSDMHCHWVYLL